MKTITIDDKKIEISDESYEAFKKQFVTKDKAILWKPDEGEEYWSINYDGEVDDYTWYNNGYNDEQETHDFELGNIYKTKEEAEEALKTGWIAKRKAEVEILRFIAENDLEFEPDWSSGPSPKCYIQYDHSDFKFKTEACFRVHHGALWYFQNYADAQKVIDAMTPQLKILFGVR